MDKCVPWTIFVWVVAIATAIIAGLLSIQISQMTALSEIKGDLAVVKTDVVWIKQELLRDNQVGLSK